MLTYDLENFLIKNAEKSCVNQKHSAALLKNGKIIGVGYNKYCSFAKKSTIHAEIDVLMNMKRKYKKYQMSNLDIIIIRISPKDSLLKNSRPCDHCIDSLRKFHIKRVYYSNEYGEIVCEKIEDMKKMHVCSGDKFREKLKYTCNERKYNIYTEKMRKVNKMKQN